MDDVARAEQGQAEQSQTEQRPGQAEQRPAAAELGQRPGQAEQRPRLVTKDFCLLFLACLILYAIYFLMITTMARYSIVTFGVKESLAGLAASIFFAGSLVARLITGRYSKRYPLKNIAILGLSLMVVASALYLFAAVNLGVLILIRILHGLSFGCASSVIPAMVVSKLPKSYMGTGTGYFSLSITLGTALGPLIGLLVAGGFDYNVLFSVCFGAVVVAFVAVLFVKGPGKTLAGAGAAGAASPSAVSAPAQSTPKERFTFSSMIERKTVWISAFMLIICLAYSSYNAYMNTYSISLDLASWAPFSFTVYGLALLIFRPFAGKLMDKRGDNIVIIPSIIAQAVGLALLALFPSGPMLLVVGIFMSLGFGTMMTSGQAVVTKLVTPAETAIAITTFFIFCDLGAGLGPYILGFIISSVGYFWMYIIAALFTLIAVLYYYLTHGRKAKARSQESRPTD